MHHLRAMALLGTLSLAASAWGHPGHEHVGNQADSLLGGWMHGWLGLDHWLLLALAGLVAWRQQLPGGRTGLALATGVGYGALAGLALPTGLGVAGGWVALGLLLTAILASRPGRGTTLGLVAASGFVAGIAHGPGSTLQGIAALALASLVGCLLMASLLTWLLPRGLTPAVTPEHVV